MPPPQPSPYYPSQAQQPYYQPSPQYPPQQPVMMPQPQQQPYYQQMPQVPIQPQQPMPPPPDYYNKPIYHKETHTPYSKRKSPFNNVKMWILISFILLSFILSIISIFLPWYYVRIDIDEIENTEIDGLIEMEDKLGEREEYMEFEYLGVKEKDTDIKDNDELKHDYPDTANCKNITTVLVVIQIILLIIVLIIISVYFFKPSYNFSGAVIFVFLILIISILLTSYFTLAYGPYEGDTDSEESELVVDVEESGNWFHTKFVFSGDIEGEGEGGVGSGYVVSIIIIILLILAFIISILLKKEFKQTYYPHQMQYNPPPQ